MKVGVDLEALEFLREDQEERKEERVGGQVVSMLDASSSQDGLTRWKYWKVGHRVNHSHGPVEYKRELEDDFQPKNSKTKL